MVGPSPRRLSDFCRALRTLENVTKRPLPEISNENVEAILSRLGSFFTALSRMSGESGKSPAECSDGSLESCC